MRHDNCTLAGDTEHHRNGTNPYWKLPVDVHIQALFISVCKVTWPHFRCLATQPYLWPFSGSCGHMIMLYNSFLENQLLPIFSKTASYCIWELQWVCLMTTAFIFSPQGSPLKKVDQLDRSHDWPNLQRSRHMTIMGRLHYHYSYTMKTIYK